MKLVYEYVTDCGLIERIHNYIGIVGVLMLKLI